MRDQIPSLHGIRAAIIDLDGTMLDTAPDFQGAINCMCAEFGLAPVALETIKTFVGKGSENLVRRVLGIDFDAQRVEQHFESALASYFRHYLAINGKYTSLYPGVTEGLAALRDKGLRLACVTNKPIAFALPLMRQKGLDGYFEVVYGGDSLAKKKPDPAPLLQVCTDFCLEPRQVVAIGDSSNDVQAARAAGCRVLTVPYGYKVISGKEHTTTRRIRAHCGVTSRLCGSPHGTRRALHCIPSAPRSRYILSRNSPNHGEDIQKTDSDGIVETLFMAASFVLT